jgi:hypothetical protein
MFLSDELLPDAILIEYIPNLQELDLKIFSKDRTAKLRQILNEIHEAGVYHGDAWPRNMMISFGPEKERVLWADFDTAQTFPADSPLTPRQQKWLKEENDLVDYFLKNLVCFITLNGFATS